jgi:molybdopterin converting factor small subunit
MPRVIFARHLQNLLPLPESCEIAARTAAEAVHEIEERFPGVAAYLVHENGALRQHVNIFIGERWLQDRQRLSDPLRPDDEITIMPALSGG